MKSLILSASCLLLLLGCLGEDDATSPSNTTRPGTDPQAYNIRSESSITSIDRENREIHTADPYSYCEDGQLVTGIDSVVVSYEIAGDSLVLNSGEDCSLQRFRGNSTDVLGTWTNGREIPLPDAPTWCAEESLSAEETVYTDMSVSITSDKMVTTGRIANFCIADEFSDFEKIDCSTVSMAMGQDTITITFESVNLINGYTITANLRNTQGQSCPATIKDYNFTEAECAAGLDMSLENCIDQLLPQ